MRTPAVDKFEELEGKTVAAVIRVSALIEMGRRSGFRRIGAAAAVAGLAELLETLDRLRTGDVTEAMLEAAVAKCDQALRALMPAIEAPGSPN